MSLTLLPISEATRFARLHTFILLQILMFSFLIYTCVTIFPKLPHYRTCMYRVIRDMSELWIDRIGQTTTTVVDVCACVCARMSHMSIGKTKRCSGDWTLGGQSNRRTKKFCMMVSLTIGAAQQTVLRLLEGQQTWNGEMNNTHKIFRKRHIGRPRVGWIFKERQYEDLDLRDKICSVQITTIVCFCNVTASPTAHNTQSTMFLCP